MDKLFFVVFLVVLSLFSFVLASEWGSIELVTKYIIGQKVTTGQGNDTIVHYGEIPLSEELLQLLSGDVFGQEIFPSQFPETDNSFSFLDSSPTDLGQTTTIGISSTGSEVREMTLSDNSSGIVEAEVGVVNDFTTGSTINTSSDMDTPLQIIEVFAKDTALLGEYIVIESQEGWSGAVEVVGLGQGVASKIFPIFLLPGEKVLITDTPTKIGYRTGPLISLSSLTLTDSGEELVLISSDGSIFQTVIYQATFSDQALFPDHIDELGHTIFSRLGTPTPLTDPYSEDSSDGNGSGDEITSSTGLHLGETTTGDIFMSGTNTFSGSSQTGQTFTGSTSDPLCTHSGFDVSFILPDIQITEIHPYDTDDFPEYIELFVQGIFPYPITIYGAGQGSASKSISLTGYQGRIIVTDAVEYFPSATQLIQVGTLSLTDGGEILQLIGQSGHVLDNIVYTAGKQGKSLYFSTGTDPKTFSLVDIPSPGFDITQVKHVIFDKNFTNFYSCSIDLQNTKPFYVGQKINLIASASGKQLQNSSTNYLCERELPETAVNFTGCNPSYYDYRTGGIYTVGLTVTDLTTLQSCHTTLSLNYPLDPTAGQVCKQNYYQDLYLKWKGRFDHLKKGLSAFGLSANTSGDVTQKLSTTTKLIEQLTGAIQIISILPNPSGKDDGHETITFYNTDTLSYILSGMYLFNGNSKKKLPSNSPLLLPGQTLTITGTLGLTNKPTCVTLQDTKIIYSRFCYPQAADDQLFTESLQSLQTVTHEDTKLLSQLTVSLGTEEACVLFQKQPLFCKVLKYSDNIVKEYKTQAKKFLSMEKKFLKERERSASYKTKYDDTRKKRTEDKVLAAERLKREKTATQLANKQKKLAESTTYLLLQELETHRRDIYQNSSLSELKVLYTTLRSHLIREQPFYIQGGILLPVEQIEMTYDLVAQGKLPLGQIDVDELYHPTFTTSKQTVDDFLENLTIAKDWKGIYPQ